MSSNRIVQQAMTNRWLTGTRFDFSFYGFREWKQGGNYQDNCNGN